MIPEDEPPRLVGIQYATKSKEIAPERMKSWAKAEMMLFWMGLVKAKCIAIKNNIV